MELIQNLLIFIIGAIFGSAANALIDRLPRGESWVKGKSHCDKCGHGLKGWDMVPILSYLNLAFFNNTPSNPPLNLRGGRYSNDIKKRLFSAGCRYCGSPIPRRNLVVEIIVGLAFVVINWHLWSFNSFLISGIFWVTVIIAAMDWETKLVSEKMVVAWGGFVVVYQLTSLTVGQLSWTSSIVGLIAGIMVIGGIWLITKKKAMGEGDIEIAAVMGWWLSWPNIMIALWVAFVTGAVFGLWSLVAGKAKLKSEIAFGPFLVIGSWVGYVWGDKIWALIGIL